MKLAFFVIIAISGIFIANVYAQTITIQTNKEQFSGGDTVTLTGNVENGKSGDLVALEIKNPDGETILIRTVTLGDGGTFTLQFKIPQSEKTGNYAITANAQVDGKTVTETKTISQAPESKPSISSSEKKGGGCLIATATYGSELAPQVQLLREIRDNSLLQTDSGTSFMTGFNQFYYSFSPSVADWERENPIFKEFVKISLTPMLSSLSLLQNVDLNSESSVLGYGISLILLNIGMYFIAPGIVIYKIRKIF